MKTSYTCRNLRETECGKYIVDIKKITWTWWGLAVKNEYTTVILRSNNIGELKNILTGEWVHRDIAEWVLLKTLKVKEVIYL